MYRFFLPVALFFWGLYLIYEGLYAQKPGSENEWKWGLAFMVIAIVIGALRFVRYKRGT